MNNSQFFFENAPLIHIGYPKCISKWMQKNLFVPENGFIKYLNPESVQNLIISPKPFRFENSGIHVKVDFTKSRALKIFSEQQAKKLIPVITSEALVGNLFCGGYDAEILSKRLSITFPDAKILIVIREQKNIIRSLYSTAVAWGLPHRIEDFLVPHNENFVPQFNLNFLCYDKLVENYQNIFSKENVIVIPYELFNSNPSEFIEKILIHYPQLDISKKILSLPFDLKVNQGQTILETNIFRLLNRWLLKTPFNYGGIIEDRATWRDLRNIWRVPIKNKSNIINYFENNFATKVKQITHNSFSNSNRRLVSLTGLNLADLGYEI